MLLRLRVNGSLVDRTPIALRDFSTTPKMIVPAGATVLPPALRSVASFVSNVRPGLSCDDNGPTIVTTMVVPAGMVAAGATACPRIQKQNGRRKNVLLFGQRERMTVFMPASAILFDPESFRVSDVRLIPRFVESFRFGRSP